MTSLSDATAAPLKWKGHTLHPLTLGDLGRFERWAKDNVMEQARYIIRDEALDPDKAAALLDRAYLQASQCSLVEEAGIATLQSVEGMVYLIWLSLRKGNEGMTLDEAGDAAGSLEAAGELTEQILKISGFFGGEDAKKNGETELEEIAEKA